MRPRLVFAFQLRLRPMGNFCCGGGKNTKSFSYDDVIELGNECAKGKDEFGYRAEFINLSSRLAKIAAGF